MEIESVHELFSNLIAISIQPSTPERSNYLVPRGHKRGTRSGTKGEGGRKKGREGRKEERGLKLVFVLTKSVGRAILA